MNYDLKDNLMNELIRLDDLLGLTKEEIKNSKINLNMTSNGVECLKLWQENNDDVLFSYWSHYGKWKGPEFNKPKCNFQVGKIVYGFVRLGNDRWLLVTVGKITFVPEVTNEKPEGDYCSFEIIKKYVPLFGKLIIKLRKGNKYSRYAFDLSTFIDNSYVEQILPSKFGSISFPGYHNLNINFKELNTQIENLDWRSALEAINGIYLITDDSNNKKYVGSAYGISGFYGRWRTYLDNGYDDEEEQSGERFPNSQLKQIAKDKDRGLSYINKYFRFSILETIPSNFSKNDVIKRENHWKEILNTRNKCYGYNSN